MDIYPLILILSSPPLLTYLSITTTTSSILSPRSVTPKLHTRYLRSTRPQIVSTAQCALGSD